MPISEITVVHAVEFSETDAAGLVHFSNYFRYMEKAERELFSQANIPLVVDDGTLFFGWPRVNASCDFCAPLRFGDRVSIHLSIQEISRKAIRYRVRFTRNEPEDGTLVASGGMTALSAHLDRVKKTIATHPAGESILERLAAQLKPDKESGIS
ncbi:MAG: acyl-CoA thioesterase [Verrucomicrobiota bacterium]|nr:acyl-CoA thioesterase [Verrucomicrobiota bacterium]